MNLDTHLIFSGSQRPITRVSDRLTLLFVVANLEHINNLLMRLLDHLKQLADELNLSDEMRKDLDDFVDNFIGAENEGYVNLNDYKIDNLEKVKSLLRVIKEGGKYPYFKKLITPFAYKGIDNLLNEVE